MPLLKVDSLKALAKVPNLKEHIIAYPTESVFGLGCLVNKPELIEQVINIKSRNDDKGLVILASKVSQLKGIIDLRAIPKDLKAILEELNFARNTSPHNFYNFAAIPGVSATYKERIEGYIRHFLSALNSQQFYSEEDHVINHRDFVVDVAKRYELIKEGKIHGYLEPWDLKEWMENWEKKAEKENDRDNLKLLREYERDEGYRLNRLRHLTIFSQFLFHHLPNDMVKMSVEEFNDFIYETVKLSCLLHNTGQGITLLLPAAPSCPEILKGKYATVAVRFTNEPFLKELIETMGGALISTSANYSGHDSINTPQGVYKLLAADARSYLMDNVVVIDQTVIYGPHSHIKESILVNPLSLRSTQNLLKKKRGKVPLRGFNRNKQYLFALDHIRPANIANVLYLMLLSILDLDEQQARFKHDLMHELNELKAVNPDIYERVVRYQDL
ncbi:Sua5/YciO/YrdC/YwlC family protein [Psittacicella hinzii]|uniref:L-threonylcarbamoyladenylate synthase n=1 Tax=Psittacicella hinzii TaxID=2028575 RepID=A0A3A1YI11_9GAMM|nr:Sua5/YciO/YrdC/YwlC family protein [Psittacicella hinzii]RIY37086.1 hypothetical protein CKF58_05525 [Psittacicella hinzii]